MEYTLDESKRILIIEKEGAKGAAGGLKPETGGGATNTPGEGEEGEGGGADRSGLEGLCSEKLVDLVFILATKLDRNVDDMRAQLHENSVATDEKIHILESSVTEKVASNLHISCY